MRRATTTEPDHHAATIERNNRRTRWLHAAVYLAALALLVTGWWLWSGSEGHPSVLARASGVSDAELHTKVGWVLFAVAISGTLVGWRATRTLLRASVRFHRSDLRWLVLWPHALFTGRFGRHDGHFDPGQRIANLVMLTSLLLLIASGAGLALVSGGPAFVWLAHLHRWSTYVFTPVIIGHILIASGALPGYRGVWRAMHLGGRLRTTDARRVWPGWTERQQPPR